MNRLLSLSLLFSMLVSPALAENLPAGTPVQIALDKEIDADLVKEGQVIPAHLIAPVKKDGKVVLPAGTAVKGVVSQRKNNFIFGVPGSIELSNFKITSPDGELTPLTGNYQRKGNSRIAIALVGGYFLLLPIFIKGEDGIVENNAEMTMYTAQELQY